MRSESNGSTLTTRNVDDGGSGGGGSGGGSGGGGDGGERSKLIGRSIDGLRTADLAACTNALLAPRVQLPSRRRSDNAAPSSRWPAIGVVAPIARFSASGSETAASTPSLLLPQSSSSSNAPLLMASSGGDDPAASMAAFSRHDSSASRSQQP